jgi:hypothetical protein
LNLQHEGHEGYTKDLCYGIWVGAIRVDCGSMWSSFGHGGLNALLIRARYGTPGNTRPDLFKTWLQPGQDGIGHLRGRGGTLTDGFGAT